MIWGLWFYAELVKTKNRENDSTGGRQAAYLARNRASLIKSAQEVLADIGPEATIEQLASYAQVSSTTLYKYFENKETLFAEALDQAWREWVIWSYNGAQPASSLEAVTDSARKLFWIKDTHPIFAKVIQNVLRNPKFMIDAIREGATATFKSLAKQGYITEVDFEKRIVLWAYCLIGLLTSVHVTGELSPQDAEGAFGIGLSIWGVSEAKAKKLMSRPLVFTANN